PACLRRRKPSSACTKAHFSLTQPAFIVAKQQEDAQIVCDYTNDGDATDLRIALLKQMGNESIKVCALSFTTNFEPVSRKVGQCRVDLGHERVNVTLPQLQTTDAGLYICTMERIFPPPYYPVQGKGTHLYVVDTEPCPDIHLYFWIIMSAFAGLLGYSILLTACIMRKVVSTIVLILCVGA
uniref:Cytotoxic T-lymphocyte protein 4 n=1 Tax=Varanus komodoensis TaxID=61221 RepID=A0A8D2LCJ8_VARKO